MTRVTSYKYDETGPYIEKDPDAVLDYPIDLTDWLGADTLDTTPVTGTRVEVSANGVLDSTVINDPIVTAWVSGGDVGDVITVTFKIVTTSGRNDDRSIRLIVGER